VPTHPVAGHSLDVSAVAMAVGWCCPIDIDPRMLAFLVSLHDIGKFSRPFQAKVPEHWPSALGPYRPAPAGPPHDTVGLFLLSGPLAGSFGDLLPSGGRRGWNNTTRTHLWRAITGHHGKPPAAHERLGPDVVCAACVAAARYFVLAMRAALQPPPWERPPRERDVVRLSWRLAGLTTLADWVGSRQEWFPYAAAVADPARYLWNRIPHAAAALCAAGLATSGPS
jgi:CRISPR-associated endonuclease/helicase Cas3